MGMLPKGLSFSLRADICLQCPLIIPKRSRMPFGEGMEVPKKTLFGVILNQELFKFLQSLQ